MSEGAIDFTAIATLISSFVLPPVLEGLLTLAKIKHELEASTGRIVDIALKEAIEDSENWIRRNEILKTAQVIYEQR